MTTGPDFTININHQDIRQGASALGVVEQLLRSIDQRLGLMSASSSRVNQTLNITRNTIVQNHTAITQVNQDLSRTTNVLNQVESGTRRWGNSLRSVNLTVSRLLTNFSRLSARSGALAASGFGSLQRRGSQSFGGLFNGGGIPGILGDVVRTPFAVGEFGLRIGGDLAQGVLGGLGRVLGGAGGALGQGAGLGLLAGGPAGLIGGALAGGGSILASTAGGAAGIGGAILGALGQSAGAILGAAGELGGRIAESLTRGASRGLLIGAGVSLFSITQAAEFQQLEKGFGALLKGTEDQAAALERLEDAADGTISKIGLLKSANLALSLGVATTSKEIATLVEGSRLLGRQLGINPEKAFDRLTVGLARGSLKVLDDLGLNPNREKAYKDYAASIGALVTDLDDLQRSEAFAEAALQELAERVDRAKMSGDGLAESTRSLSDLLDSLKASASDLSVEWGLALAPAAYEVGDAMKELLRDGKEWLELHQSDIAEGTVNFLRGIPGFFRDASAAARSLTADISRALGFSDETIQSGAAVLYGNKRSPFEKAARAAVQTSAAVGPVIGSTAGLQVESFLQEQDSLGGRLSIFGRNFVKDLPVVFDRMKDGIGSVLGSDAVKSAAETLGEAVADGILAGIRGAVDGPATGIGDALVEGGYLDIDLIKLLKGEFPATLGPKGRQIRDATLGTTPLGALLTSDAGQNAALGIVSPGAALGRLITGGRSGPSAGGPVDPRGIAGLLPSVEEILASAAPGRQQISSTVGRLGFNPDAIGLIDYLEGKAREVVGAGGDLSNEKKFDRFIKAQVAAFSEALKDSERGLRDELREREDFLRGLDRVHQRQRDAIEDLVDEMGKVTDAHYEQAVAIKERSAAEREEVRRRANESLQVLPNEVANRFAGELDQPGIALHARHAFARETRLRRRERARDINQAFGSRGFEDAFGNRGFGGFGTGTPAADEIFGGLSGSLTATEATEQLLEAVKASAEFAEEAAKIRNAALEETAKISREEAKARAELDAEFLKTITALNASLEGVHANEKRLTEAVAAAAARASVTEKALVDLQRQIRSVK